jgi:hypothetical protein
MADIGELAASYLEYWRAPDPKPTTLDEYLVAHRKPGWEYYFDLDRLLSEEPEDVWAFIDAVIARSEDTEQLGAVGAGPLEELMLRWGGQFADRLVARVSTGLRWAYAAWMVQRAAGAEEAQAVISARWPKLSDDVSRSIFKR